MAPVSVKFSSVYGPRSIGMIALLIVGLISPQLQASIEQQRQLFHDASAALKRNKITKFNKILKQLEDYPAKPYLEYDAFSRRVSKAKPQQVEKFLQQFADFPFAYHARGKWLNVLARRGDWENYLKFFDDRENTRLQCLAFQARLKLNQLEGLNDEIARVWSRGYSQPSQCDPAFAYFLKSNEQAEQAIWLRIEKAFKARRPNLARYLSKQLDQQARATVETWYRAHRRPERSLRQLAEAEDNHYNRAIIVHAIDRLARKNSLKALEYWNLIRDDFAFTQEQKDQSHR